MTQEQIERAQALARCCFLPGHRDKAFATSMAERSRRDPPMPLTERQAAHLARLAFYYRRQMPKHLVPASEPE